MSESPLRQSNRPARVGRAGRIRVHDRFFLSRAAAVTSSHQILSNVRRWPVVH
jgi:hypothetical protein